MAKKSAVSDESLARALGLYAGMVDMVLSDPARWLGVDEDPAPGAGIPARALDAVRDRALGAVNPTSAGWSQQPVATRVDWWVDRIGASAGLASAAPRFAGALADRLPLQAALGASAAGLAVCAVAREHGVQHPGEWVPLLAKVLVDRDLPARGDAVPSSAEAEQALATPTDDEPGVRADGAGEESSPTVAPATDATGSAAPDDQPSPGRAAALGRGAQRAAQTLWRLAQTFRELQNLLDERPRGGFLARTLAKFPVVGVAGGWLDERGGIRKAAEETTALVAQRT